MWPKMPPSITPVTFYTRKKQFKNRCSIRPVNRTGFTSLAPKIMVVNCDLSPHSAKNVNVKACKKILDNNDQALGVLAFFVPDSGSGSMVCFSNYKKETNQTKNVFVSFHQLLLPLFYADLTEPPLAPLALHLETCKYPLSTFSGQISQTELCLCKTCKHAESHSPAIRIVLQKFRFNRQCFFFKTKNEM